MSSNAVWANAGANPIQVKSYKFQLAIINSHVALGKLNSIIGLTTAGYGRGT